MDGDRQYSIGELARRSGLTVKAVRLYSDRGIVPPSGRTPSGHRYYDGTALARLDFVRTLRDLGLDLATIRQVVDREAALSDVAAAHAEAVQVQIRVLLLRHALLTALARRGTTAEETNLVHRLAELTEAERHRLIGEFLDSVFDGLDHPTLAGIARSMTPELPASPDTDQVDAWVELVELSLDPDFRAIMRRIAEQHDAGYPETGLPRHPAADIRDTVTPALRSGVDPRSPEAVQVVAALTARHGTDQLLTLVDTAADPRKDRYFELLAVINGWAAPSSQAPAFRWLADALHA